MSICPLCVKFDHWVTVLSGFFNVHLLFSLATSNLGGDILRPCKHPALHQPVTPRSGFPPTPVCRCFWSPHGCESAQLSGTRWIVDEGLARV